MNGKVELVVALFNEVVWLSVMLKDIVHIICFLFLRFQILQHAFAHLPLVDNVACGHYGLLFNKLDLWSLIAFSVEENSNLFFFFYSFTDVVVSCVFSNCSILIIIKM